MDPNYTPQVESAMSNGMLLDVRMDEGHPLQALAKHVFHPLTCTTNQLEAHVARLRNRKAQSF
jgi:hypothetical protein